MELGISSVVMGLFGLCGAFTSYVLMAARRVNYQTDHMREREREEFNYEKSLNLTRWPCKDEQAGSNGLDFLKWQVCFLTRNLLEPWPNDLKGKIHHSQRFIKNSVWEVCIKYFAFCFGKNYSFQFWPGAPSCSWTEFILTSKAIVMTFWDFFIKLNMIGVIAAIQNLSACLLLCVWDTNLKSSQLPW